MGKRTRARARLRRKTVVYITQKHNINVTLAGAFWKASADPLENAPKRARIDHFLVQQAHTHF